MGYACPVCDDPQADGEHLANHLAFTALLHGADHEAWLDTNVPDWEDNQPAELANRVTDLADEAVFPQQFEDTTDAHDSAPPDRNGVNVPESASDIQSAADSVVQEILEEARELTREAADQRTDSVDEPDPGSDDPDGESEDR